MTAPLDLGALRAPLLVFGGPYGNLQATQAVFGEAKRLGLAPDQVICSGDCVAYCGAPAATVDLIRDLGIVVVQGNVEEQIGSNAADCGYGYEPGTACDVLSCDWYAACLAALTQDAADWMAGLPAAVRFSIGNTRLAVLHGGLERNNQILFESTEMDEKCRQLEALRVDVVIAGHTGIPFTQALGAGYWHNAGVVGMPANDGTPQTWYTLITEAGEGGVSLTHHRLAYDHAGAARDMRANGFPEPYARALETGLWPSLDMLPERETAETGHLWRQSARRSDLPGKKQARSRPASFASRRRRRNARYRRDRARAGRNYRRRIPPSAPGRAT